jgi:predicted DNA-binding protein
MLKSPFSRPIVRPQPSTPPCLNESLSTSPATSIRHTLPATVRRGNTLVRSIDDPDAYYITELRTARLDEIESYLWLAGLSNCARPLHRQQLLGREIIITEDPNEHLVWHKTRIFIKPLPIFLVDLDCWTRKICKTKQLYEAACGLSDMKATFELHMRRGCYRILSTGPLGQSL